MSGPRKLPGNLIRIGLAAKKVGTSPRSLKPDRWLGDAELAFPKPTVINGQHYWDEDEIDQWLIERARVSRSLPKPTDSEVIAK